MSRTRRHVIAPRSIRVAHGGMFGGKKRSIAYSLDLEGGRTSFRVAHVVI
jgi:hypothetical protein